MGGAPVGVHTPQPHQPPAPAVPHTPRPGQKINLGRANALKLVSAAASAVLRNVTGACLGPVSGGAAINAIPSQARAVVAVSGSVGHGAKLGTEREH